MNSNLLSVNSSGKRKRILQIFSRYKEYGGEEGSVYRVGDELARSYDIGTFLASSEELFSGGPISKGIGALKAFSNWSLVRQLRHYQEIGNYDCWIIHNVFPAMSPSVYSLAFDMKVPVIQYLHNYRMGCVNGFFLNHGKPCQRCMHGNFFPALETACWHESHLQSGMMGAVMTRARGMGLFDRVAQWVAISEAQRQEHLAMGIPSDKITTIHHFLQSTEIPPDYPEIGDVIFVGRLSQEKGVDCLLLAWGKIHHCGRKLWIVGDGPERAKLEMMSKALCLTNVHFTGFLEHEAMKQIWEGAACSIIPSIWKEPFGMVVLEAWAKGRPVVANRLGALPELIDDGKNGILVSPDSSEEMAAAILKILQNATEGAMMGNNGFAKLQRDFTTKNWMEKMHGVISRAVTKSSDQNL